MLNNLEHCDLNKIVNNNKLFKVSVKYETEVYILAKDDIESVRIARREIARDYGHLFANECENDSILINKIDDISNDFINCKPYGYDAGITCEEYVELLKIHEKNKSSDLNKRQLEFKFL